MEGAAPDDLPAIAPDLIVLSEVLYFMTEEEIVRLAAWLCGHATTDAQVLAVSWQGATGEVLSGGAAVEHLATCLAGPSAAQIARATGSTASSAQAGRRKNSTCL
jgi:hypothetical protein